MNNGRACRFCKAPLLTSFVDLGMSPLCESYVDEKQLNAMEAFYPLHAYVCDECFLVQLDEFVSPEDIYSHYAYFSSYSDSWVEHARVYTETVIDEFDIGSSSFVMEVASNDGYLLQHFVKNNIPCLGVEPAANIAEVARSKGVPTVVSFFGSETAKELVEQHGQADLIVANNVFAHTPYLIDFVAGLKICLKNTGIVTIEIPHLMRLIEGNQFDTIYHEHFCYFSLYTARMVFAAHGLRLFDVEELATHGGSLRMYVCHDDDTKRQLSDRAQSVIQTELDKGYNNSAIYEQFSERVHETKRKILSFLISEKRKGKSIVGYGAPGKGNTLLNYCGVRQDFLDYTVDRNTFKQGKYLPGTRIPIREPEEIARTRPDYVFVLPWNLEREIVDANAAIRDWGGKFVIPIPELRVI